MADKTRNALEVKACNDVCMKVSISQVSEALPMYSLGNYL